MPPPPRYIRSSVPPVRAQVWNAWPPHCPEQTTGSARSASEKIGVVTSAKDRRKLPSPSQYYAPMPLIWN